MKTADQRIQTMVRMAQTLTIIRTDSDIEALLTEARLIKERQPKFNIMLRDDKQYFYVGFGQEDFPKIFLTHQPQRLGIRAIGPFTDGAALKTVLRFLRNVFPYCTCKQRHRVPCLNSHIGKCLGVCCLKVPATAEQKRRYHMNIRAIRDILNGKRQSLIRQLERRMKTLGKRHELEEALKLQTTITKLKRIFENAKIIKNWRLETGNSAPIELKRVLKLKHAPVRIEGYDISNISGRNATGSLVVFSNSAPDNRRYRLFNIRAVKSSDDTAMLREVLTRRLAHPEWPYPDLIIVDGGMGQLNAIMKTLKQRRLRVPVVALTKNSHHRGDHIYATTLSGSVPLARLPEPVRNLILHVDSEAHRFAIKQYRLRHRRTLI